MDLLEQLDETQSKQNSIGLAITANIQKRAALNESLTKQLSALQASRASKLAQYRMSDQGRQQTSEFADRLKPVIEKLDALNNDFQPKSESYKAKYKEHNAAVKKLKTDFEPIATEFKNVKATFDEENEKLQADKTAVGIACEAALLGPVDEKLLAEEATLRAEIEPKIAELDAEIVEITKQNNELDEKRKQLLLSALQREDGPFDVSNGKLRLKCVTKQVSLGTNLKRIVQALLKTAKFESEEELLQILARYNTEPRSSVTLNTGNGVYKVGQDGNVLYGETSRKKKRSSEPKDDSASGSESPNKRSKTSTEAVETQPSADAAVTEASPVESASS